MRSEWEFCTLFLHFTFFYKAKFFGKNKELGRKVVKYHRKKKKFGKNHEKPVENFMGKLWKCF